MSNQVSAFAINADDVSRARQFYQKVFGWRFQPWGPPDFYLIETGSEKAKPEAKPGVMGLMQQRRELVPGSRMIGYECTITVAGIDETIGAVLAAGGKLATPKLHIPTVGTCAYFLDPEGNVAGLMQPESKGK
jgi:predicted enzyme related to lactoylglutathione lyase